MNIVWYEIFNFGDTFRYIMFFDGCCCYSRDFRYSLLEFDCNVLLSRVQTWPICEKVEQNYTLNNRRIKHMKNRIIDTKCPQNSQEIKSLMKFWQDCVKMIRPRQLIVNCSAKIFELVYTLDFTATNDNRSIWLFTFPEVENELLCLCRVQ